MGRCTTTTSLRGGGLPTLTPTLTCALAAWKVQANITAAIVNFKVFIVFYMNIFISWFMYLRQWLCQQV
jgi:hypothetical protein